VFLQFPLVSQVITGIAKKLTGESAATLRACNVLPVRAIPREIGENMRTLDIREEFREWVNAKMLREKQVRDLTGLSRVTRWRLEKEGQFPKKILLTQRCVGWLETEVRDWLKRRAEARG
jgi:prophage regulatory protein